MDLTRKPSARPLQRSKTEAAIDAKIGSTGGRRRFEIGRAHAAIKSDVRVGRLAGGARSASSRGRDATDAAIALTGADDASGSSFQAELKKLGGETSSAQPSPRLEASKKKLKHELNKLDGGRDRQRGPDDGKASPDLARLTKKP